MKPKMYDLTKAEIDEALDVRLDTGIFIRKRSRGVGRVGTVAGTLVGKGYRVININSRLYTAHRLMWFYVYGYWPKTDIDHVNCDRDDNRISNLRLAHRSENNVNSEKPKNNTSGFKGAYFDKRRGRWASEIWVFKSKKFLGYFDTAAEAGEAYQSAARDFYGDFARAA